MSSNTIIYFQQFSHTNNIQLIGKFNSTVCSLLELRATNIFSPLFLSLPFNVLFIVAYTCNPPEYIPRFRMLFRFVLSIYEKEGNSNRERERESDARQTEKNKSLLKQLSEVAISLTRRRLVCFSACVKLNSSRNFKPTMLLHFRWYIFSFEALREREKEVYPTLYTYRITLVILFSTLLPRLWSTFILRRWYSEDSVGLWWSDSDPLARWYEPRSPISSANLSHLWTDDMTRIWQSHEHIARFLVTRALLEYRLQYLTCVTHVRGRRKDGIKIFIMKIKKVHSKNNETYLHIINFNDINSDIIYVFLQNCCKLL